MALKLESRGGLVKARNSASIPRISGSASLGWGLRICVSNKPPGDAVAGPEMIL